MCVQIFYVHNFMSDEEVEALVSFAQVFIFKKKKKKKELLVENVLMSMIYV